MGKLTIIVLLILLAVGGGVAWMQWSVSKNPVEAPANTESIGLKDTLAQLTPVPAVQGVTVRVYFPDKEGSGQRLGGQNALESLSLLAQEKKWQITVKEAKYGKIVERIGEVVNGDGKKWVYTVNGKPSVIASDRYLVKPGDIIEWKYQ